MKTPSPRKKRLYTIREGKSVPVALCSVGEGSGGRVGGRDVEVDGWETGVDADIFGCNVLHASESARHRALKRKILLKDFMKPLP